MLKKYIIPFLFVLLLIGNRAISQSFSFGGLYFYEVFILLALLSNPLRMYKVLLSNFPALILLLYVVGVIFVEFITTGVNLLVLRRSALGIYILTPVVIIAFHNEIKNFLQINYNLIICTALAFALFQVDTFQPTMAAQLIGAIFVFELMNNRKDFRYYLLLSIYFILVSGVTTGQSVFRTPVLTTLAAIAIAFFFSKRKLLTPNSLPRYLIAAVALLLVVMSGALDSVIGSIVLGVSGLFDSQALSSAGSSFGSDISSTRGDAAGNTETRIMFWTSIFDYQFSHLKSFIFGYGLQFGFMEVTLPDFEFNDKHLVDPHNSFLNLFFRFGLVGLALYCWVVVRVVKLSNLHKVGGESLYPYIAIALMFASFEVVLENPHGSLIFWFILLIPTFLRKKDFESF